ncbi:MAG: DUF3822 family protein [Bacteroidetes bacterium]|nr:DUF3822 family protein [Bacteroidota bacterium]
MINLIDPTFDKFRTEKYRLSVLFRPDGYSLSVLDPRTRIFLGMSDFQLNGSNSIVIASPDTLCQRIQARFREEELLLYKYGQVDVVYASPKVTLVPPGFVKDETMEEYFRFNHPLSASEKVLCRNIPVGEMTAVYSLPSCISRLANEFFHKEVDQCSASILIQGLVKDNAHILTRQVFVNVWGSYFDIIIIQGRKLQYYNTFRKQAADDLVYFVVYVLEQMGFVPAEEVITLTGDIVSDSDEFRLLTQFIDRLHFAGMNELAEFSPVFSEVLVHKYFTLFNLPFCE